MSGSSGQGMCNSGLPRFLIGSEVGKIRELDDADMRNISGSYGEDEEEDQVWNCSGINETGIKALVKISDDHVMSSSISQSARSWWGSAP